MPETAKTAAFISTAPTTPRERKIAAGAIVASFVGFCVVVPFAQIQLPAVPAFIPLNQASFFISDLITAILLLAQLSHVRSRALLVLAAGYLFDAFMLIPHTLTFPGLFSSTGLLGAGEQTTAWIYMFWHAGFPLFVIAYAVVRERPGYDRLNGPLWKNLLLFLGGLVAASLGLTLLATAAHDFLPRVMAGDHYTLCQRIVILITWLFSIIALGFLYRRRRSSALDLWLSVVMCAWIFDVALSGVVNHSRFDLGFYAGRLYGLIAATFVLTMLLFESSSLYARVHRSQEQLVQAQKMEAIGQLAGGIAHDFNNLLSVILGTIELVEHQRGPIGRERLARLIGPAKQATESGIALTRDLLAFARSEAVAPKEIDINPVVIATSELLERTLGGKIRIETALSATGGRCLVEPNQLENALLNLAVNARDAMPDGGLLTIRTEAIELDGDGAAAHGIHAGRYVVLSVSDTGIGMPPEVQRHAFEPFFTTKDPERGTGLGLSQVYGFVNRSGGHIGLASKVGEGTTVSMYLPLISQSEESKARVPTLPSRAEHVSVFERSSPAAHPQSSGPLSAEAA
jgi:signal transduction histidine kinase